MNRSMLYILCTMILVIGGCKPLSKESVSTINVITPPVTLVETTPTSPNNNHETESPMHTDLSVSPHTITPTFTITIIKTKTPPTHTWTPLPTLSVDDAAMRVTELLETNLGCELPCWWGIIPGTTAGSLADQYLKSFTEEIYRSGRMTESAFISYQYQTLYPGEKGSINISISGGIVDRIHVGSNDNVSGLPGTNFQLDKLLGKYGEPSEVLLLYGWMSDLGILNLHLLLSFADEGILAIYTIESQRINDFYRSCPQRVSPSELILWFPIADEGVEDIYGPLDEFNNLEKVTGMDIPSFYQEFSDPQNTACIEVPINQ